MRDKCIEYRANMISRIIFDQESIYVMPKYLDTFGTDENVWEYIGNDFLSQQIAYPEIASLVLKYISSSLPTKKTILIKSCS